MNLFKSRGFKIISIALTIVLFGGWAYATLTENAEAVSEKVYTRDFSVAIPVKVAQVKTEILEDQQRYLGTFKANKDILLTSQTQGEVMEVVVKEGDRIPKNGIIAVVDAELLTFQMIAAKAALEDAQREVERYKTLTSQNAVAKVNLEKAVLQLANAESNVKSLQKQINDTKIKSPFSGTLVSKSFDLGSVLAPGSPIGRLVDLSKLKLSINVPEENILDFKIGQKINVQSDVYPAVAYPGVVTLISDVANDSHKFEVQITVKNITKMPLKSGMYGWIENTQSTHEEVVTVPNSAIIGTDKEAKVFKVVDNKVLLHAVKVGQKNAESVQILEGLSLNDIVVINGQINLKEGAEVTY